MKKTYLYMLSGLFLIVVLSSIIICQMTIHKGPANPIIGTWQFIGALDSTGNKITADWINQKSYTVLLENGTILMLGFLDSYPKGGEKPSTLQEWETINKTSWARVGTYTADLEKKTISGQFPLDTNPESLGWDFTVYYEMKGDTVTQWFDGGKMKYVNVRVK
ncbi:hypothetical protein JW935_24305 [candidate division KSB1 bacterium]|nr:hypothetical protein [candidate division KSB1 bacterium]